MFTPNTPVTVCLTCTLISLRENSGVEAALANAAFYTYADAYSHATSFPSHILIDGASAPVV